MSAAGAGERRPERGLTGAAGLLLLVAVTVGLVGQGAFYGTAQRLVGLLVAAATLLALTAWPPSGDDVRRLPVSAAPAPGTRSCDGRGQMAPRASSPTRTTSTPRSRRSWSWSAWPCSWPCWPRWRGCCGGRAPAGGGGPWAGVVAAAAAFAVHAGFDFVWHLPAVVLAATVLAGTVLPAPAPHPPVPAPPRKELHEATT